MRGVAISDAPLNCKGGNLILPTKSVAIATDRGKDVLGFKKGFFSDGNLFMRGLLFTANPTRRSLCRNVSKRN